MRPELIRVEQSVFAWLGPAGGSRLSFAKLDDAGHPGPTATLLSGASRPGCFASGVTVIADGERLTFDARGLVIERTPVVGGPIDAVHAWLAPEAAIVTSVGDPYKCLRRLDVDVSVPITPAFFGLDHPPLLRVIGRRLVWAQSGVLLGVVDFDRGARPQPLAGVARLGCAPATPPVALWIDAAQRNAALLGDGGRVERFDLDTGQSIALGWLPTGACAATATLDRFVVMDERMNGEPRWAELAATPVPPEPGRPSEWSPGPAAAWLDANALLILDRDALTRVELPHESGSGESA